MQMAGTAAGSQLGGLTRAQTRPSPKCLSTRGEERVGKVAVPPQKQRFGDLHQEKQVPWACARRQQTPGASNHGRSERPRCCNRAIALDPAPFPLTLVFFPSATSTHSSRRYSRTLSTVRSASIPFLRHQACHAASLPSTHHRVSALARCPTT